MSKISSFITTAFLILAGSWTSIYFSPSESNQKESVYEIRNYNIHPDQYEAYKEWITNHGLPYIRKHTDVVGFWLEGDLESQVNGAPLDELGSPNVTWIIRWDSKEQRDETWETAFSTEEWGEIFSKFSGGPDAYLRVEIKFFDEI